MRPHSLALLMICLACSLVQAKFIQYETRQVPMERLFTSLEQRLTRDTNDFVTTYHLARLHSMAYSTNLVEFSVKKDNEEPVYYGPGADGGVPQAVYWPTAPEERRAARSHLTNAIVLYERALLLLKKSTNMTAQRWAILPAQLGLAWCLEQAGRRGEALAGYRKTLRIAWKMEVTGDFDLKDWRNGQEDAAPAGKNPFPSGSQSYLGPGVCFSREAIGYLLKVLDPIKDAREIADLKEDEKNLQKMGRAITPILVPLGPDLPLAELVDPNARVSFDLDGSGLSRQWGWITPKAAWLVFDSDGKGQITSALQMFGNVTFWMFWQNGYDALLALDANSDGILKGPELNGMALWQDRNSNGLSDPGEVRALAEFGITAIACTYDRHPSGIAWNSRGVMFKDGTVRATYDWIAPDLGDNMRSGTLSSGL